MSVQSSNHELDETKPVHLKSKKGHKKPFVLVSRWVKIAPDVPNSIFSDYDLWKGFYKWRVIGRYETAARRAQALEHYIRTTRPLGNNKVEYVNEEDVI